MKKERFSMEQMVGVLKQVEVGWAGPYIGVRYCPLLKRGVTFNRRSDGRRRSFQLAECCRGQSATDRDEQ